MEREKTALGRKAALEELRIREEERRAAMVAVAMMCVGKMWICVLEFAIWVCPGNCFFDRSDPARRRG
jgi:hypothetical protein